MTRTIFFIIAAWALFYLFAEDTAMGLYSNVQVDLWVPVARAVRDAMP